jgi:hypothetical protein
MQPPASTGTALAGRARVIVRLVLLLSLGRRFGGIVRRFRRPGQFVETGFKRRDLLPGRRQFRK